MRIDYLSHHEGLYQERRRSGRYEGWEQEYARATASIRRVFENGRAPKSGRVLEIGCGAGNTTIWLAQQGFTAYGIDISNADIELMTKKDSPWKATATTDPSAVGAAVTRTLALQLAGQLGKREVTFPGALVTQSFLLESQIKNMDDLRAKLPDLNLGKIASAPWIASAKF